MLITNINSVESQAKDEIFGQTCKFIKSVFELGQLPTNNIPEIAFAGRSNVGKSSLINYLFQKKKLAKFSNTPGRTQSLNFFSLGELLTIVDMPGYGYAAAPKAIVNSWNLLIKDYLRGRVQLKKIFLLIDSRHGIKINDQLIMDILNDYAVIYQIVLTKIDKVASSLLLERIAAIENIFNKNAALFPEIIISSSKKNIGLSEIKNSINCLCNVVKQ